MSAPAPYDAVVLAGGAARRMGGVDKPLLEVGGDTLLDRVLSAVADAERIVVVGPRRPTAVPVVWTREDPPLAGPAAAVAAALPHLRAPWVSVLAGDLPFLSSTDVLALRLAADGAEGALLVDAEGRAQWLCGVWRTAALRGCDLGRDRSLRSAFEPLAPRHVPGPGRAAFDCDTPDDLTTARGLA